VVKNSIRLNLQWILCFCNHSSNFLCDSDAIPI